MKILTLTLSLLVTACQTADNNSSRSLKSNLGRHDVELTISQVKAFKDKVDEIELENVSTELKNYVSIVPQEYFADLKSRLFSIEEASKLCLPALNFIESTSEAFAFEARKENDCGEEYVNGANNYLAKLLKLETPPHVQQAAFDAWKDSGFSDVRFMELVKETMHHSPDSEYFRQLAENASGWHLYTGKFLQMSGKNLKDANNHFAQATSIDFIYHGLITLNSADSAEFEKCIKNESFNDIRALGKKIVSANEYSEQFLLKAMMMKSDDIDFFEDSKIVLMANVFSEEFHLAWKENIHINIQSELRTRGVDFDVKSAVDSKDPKVIIKAYSQCVWKTADVDTKNLCIQAVQNIRSITVSSERLESLANKFNDTAIRDSSFMLKNVVEPAIIYINCLRVVVIDGNIGLKEIEVPEKEKSNLIFYDVELYKHALINNTSI